MKIEQAVREFLIEIEVRQFTPRTVKSYRNYLNTFQRFCVSAGIEDMDAVTLATVRQMTKVLTANRKKGTYINGILKGLKSFLQYCYDEGYGSFNTKRNFIWCKEEKPVITAFTPEQVLYSEKLDEITSDTLWYRVFKRIDFRLTDRGAWEAETMEPVSSIALSLYVLRKQFHLLTL